jgi:DNA-directed RNA polymerase specialized sigma subunit
LRLRLEEELTHAEIADVLGVSPLAAQRLVARAIADLRQLLKSSV